MLIIGIDSTGAVGKMLQYTQHNPARA